MKKTLLLSSVLVLVGFVAQSYAASETHWGSAGWLQFPSNDFSPIHDPGIDQTSSAQLALTAEGDQIAMSYTVATYELKPLENNSNMELQIFDAPLSAYEHDQGSGAVMELVFLVEGSDEWSVECWNQAEGKYVQAADFQESRVPIGTGACHFPSQAWSRSLRVNTGGASSFQMKTVWQGTTAEGFYADKPQHYRDILNVFRLQSRHGIIQLAPTNPVKIRDILGSQISFRTHPVKSDFEQTLNWTVLYKTQMKTFFSFEIDVSDIRSNYLLLWDKDADANQLFTDKEKEAAKPPDDGIKMMVRWSDGSPLGYDVETDQLTGGIPITENPEWTHFDQTNRANFQPPWQIAGETNQFDGPSWDSDKDPIGYDAIRWYRIPLHERKSDTVVVGWYGSTMPLNTFAFAASGPVSPAPCSDPSLCREVFELPEDEGILTCPESGHDDCITDAMDELLLSIDSDPAPETSELLEKKVKSIEYFLKIENKNPTPISDLIIHFTAPKGTSLDPSQETEIDVGLLEPQIEKQISLKVILDDNIPEDEIISSEDRILLEKDDELFSPSIIRHYPGKKIDVESGCLQEGSLRLCISSRPDADPAEESYGLDPTKADKNTIEYMIEVENVSEDLDMEQLEFHIDPPLYTSLHADFLEEVQTTDASEYSGKGPAYFEMSGLLAPGKSATLSFKVQLDEVVHMTNYDISSADLFRLRTKNHPELVVPELIHHVGNGGVKIEASRCYAFDYFAGEFSCSDMCQAVEPGTRITVRDTLKNVGGASAYNYAYFPLPLSSSFLYEKDSIRMDDPETGLTVTNDSESFPPFGGITVPSAIDPNGEREVFFSYYVPEDVIDEQDDSGCFPKTDEVIETLPPDANTPELSYDQNCNISSSSASGHQGKICVSVEDDPRLVATLSAVPLAGSTVYQGSPMSYYLEISNQSSQPVAEIQIESIQPQQSECLSGFCNDFQAEEPIELSQKFGTMSKDLQVRVNDDAQGSTIIHPGYLIRYRSADGDFLELQTNAIEHELITSPEPSGEFRHNIRLNRRTALNAAERNTPRDDQADRIEIDHEFTYEGTKKFGVWPQIVGTRYYRHNVCNWQFPSYERYDASFNAYSYLYNSTNRNAALGSYEALASADVNFLISTTSPSDRPELVLDPGSNHYTHQFQYTFKGKERGSKGLNGFMKQGGTIRPEELEQTKLRAVADGVAGRIRTENTALTDISSAQIKEDFWNYVRTSTRIDPFRCTRCTSHGCYKYPAFVPIYRWKLISGRNVPMKSSDQDFVTVLTSVAWLQTKHGHVGFGSPLWESDPGNGDPNWVQLGEQALPSLMKWYTPPDQSNADLLVLHSGQSDPVQSGLGSSGRVERAELQGFLDSPLEGEGRQLARDNAYDRRENPRDYLDDLLNRQLYGKVIRLNQASELPVGMTRNGSEFEIQGSLYLEDDTIYHLKGELRIGKVGGSPVALARGRARLIVDGSAQILSNVEYASSKASDLSKVTSIRLHTLEDIQIHPSVTDVELMMLAEGRFASGKSDKQLRILGDVIAQTVAWERRPLNKAREDDEQVNKPSEIIYEDFRKYLVSPPGDRKLAE
jgi:hypothetical protein